MTIKYTYLSLCHLSVWTLSILLKPVLPERTTLVPDERKIHLQDTNKMKRQTLCQAKQFSSKFQGIQHSSKTSIVLNEIKIWIISNYGKISKPERFSSFSPVWLRCPFCSNVGTQDAGNCKTERNRQLHQG